MSLGSQVCEPLFRSGAPAKFLSPRQESGGPVVLLESIELTQRFKNHKVRAALFTRTTSRNGAKPLAPHIESFAPHFVVLKIFAEPSEDQPFEGPPPGGPRRNKVPHIASLKNRHALAKPYPVLAIVKCAQIIEPFERGFFSCGILSCEIVFLEGREHKILLRKFQLRIEHGQRNKWRNKGSLRPWKILQRSIVFAYRDPEPIELRRFKRKCFSLLSQNCIPRLAILKHVQHLIRRRHKRVQAPIAGIRVLLRGPGFGFPYGACGGERTLL